MFSFLRKLNILLRSFNVDVNLGNEDNITIILKVTNMINKNQVQIPVLALI